MKIPKTLKGKLSLWLLIIACVGSLQSYAQQDAMYSQYMFNTLAINPAYAGSRDVLSMTALARYQWLGIDGAPTTYTFSMDMPISKERMGIGIQAFSDQIGKEKTSGAYFTYAYKVRVGPRTTLSLGTQAGFTNYNLDLINILLTQVGDPSFSQNISVFKPNAGIGFYLSNDHSYIGLSVPELVEYKLSSPNVADSVKNAGYTNRRSYLATMGFVIGLSNSLKLKPSLMARYQVGANLSLDMNMNLWIRDKIAFGVSGRLNQLKSFSSSTFGDAIIGMIEVQLSPQIRLGYAYDHYINKLGDPAAKGKTVSFGATQTHEILLRYEFGYGKNKILTPRYF